MRLRAAPATRELAGELNALDLDEPMQIDAFAEKLLDWWYASSDKEAFSLLVAVTAPLLDRAAAGVRREVGLAAAAEELVDSLFAELFVDIGLPRAPSRHFIAYGTRQMRRMAKLRAQELASGDVEGTSGALIAAALDGAPDNETERRARDYRRTLSRASHGMCLGDRRLLVAAYVDGLTEAEMASELNIPMENVATMAERALDRFLARKDSLLASTSGRDQEGSA